MLGCSSSTAATFKPKLVYFIKFYKLMTQKQIFSFFLIYETVGSLTKELFYIFRKPLTSPSTMRYQWVPTWML